MRPAIVRLWKDRKSVMEISRLLHVPHSTVSKAIQRYKKTRNFDDRKGRGRKGTANNRIIRRKIFQRLKANPRTHRNSTRKLAAVIGISKSSVHRILKSHGLKARKDIKGHFLTDRMKQKRLDRCQKLLRRFGAKRHRAILFTDEKWFDVEQAHNQQNYRTWSKDPIPLEARVISRQQKPQQLMVWAGVSYLGKTPLFFHTSGREGDQRGVLNHVENQSFALDSRAFW